MSEADTRAETDAEVEGEPEPEGQSFTGQGLNRVEDHRILTGRAEYVHDISPEGCLEMGLVRTTRAHAEIRDIDTSAAEAHPECALVLTGEDIAAEYNPMPCGLTEMSEWALAKEKVHFAGEPVALVVAEDRYVVEDIVDLVDVRYDGLDPVVDAVAAREDETVIHEDVGTNVPDSEELRFGDPEGAFAAADTVVEGEYSWGRISGVPLETGGAVAEYDPDADTFHIDANMQLHTLVDNTVFETLGYDAEDVRIEVPPDVGGSFGTKIAMHRYMCLTAMASQQLDGTPVKYVEDRVENLQGGDMHSSDREYTVRVAVDDDGTVRGFDFEFLDDFGAFPRYPINQVLKPLAVLTNGYDVEHVRYSYDLVLTNKTSQTAYRGFGVDPHLYALEMALDEAARELGVDPYDFRQINFIPPGSMPYTLPSKNIYDSGDYPAALERIRETVEDEETGKGGLLDPEVVESRREAGKYRGVAYTLHIEPGVSGADWTNRQRSDRDDLSERDREDVAELPEHLRAEVLEDGTVRAYLATDSSGQGHQTLVSQLLADELGVLPSDIEVDYLDSVDAPTEYGSAASRMAVMLSGAAAGLGDRMVEQFERLAADHWGVGTAAVTYREGTVTRQDGPETLSLADLAALDTDREESLTRASYDYQHPATELEDFDEALARKLPVYPTAAFAANAPIVEVDVATGEVELLKFYSLRDCGTQLNPVIVEGQSHGGLAQGIGAALIEEFGYDDRGQPQSVTLFDYLLPSTTNVPEMVLEHSETPSPFTVTGAKGTGEGGMIDGPAAIASSINRALEPFDVVVDEIPATANRLRRQLRDQGE
jgi:carbon-monoxide dehydrogenase large subunit